MRIFRLFIALALLSVLGCSRGPIKTDVPRRPAGQQSVLGLTVPAIDTVHIAFIGLGDRGAEAVRRYSYMPGVKISAICDVEAHKVEKVANHIASFNLPKAAEFVGAEAWKEAVSLSDVDLVYICTDWVSHTPIAVYAMEQGKNVAIEVPAATTMEEIWQLINTSEKTRKHCMMLENCCYDFFELTALNMAQKGVFGEVLHVEGSYLHCLDKNWADYWNNWRLDFNAANRGDVYPTHGLGPICQVLNIHRGDKFKTLVSVDTKAVNGPKHVKNICGQEISNFQNGDQTCTFITTENGKTILVEHNVMTPRPYDRMYQLVGTDGYAAKYPQQQFLFRSADQIEGKVDSQNLSYHKPVPEEVMDQLFEIYRSPILNKELEEAARKVGGHGGMDFIMDYRLIYCLRNGLPLDQDVYDLAEWCCVGPLSRLSIENGNAPVAVPDFTRGEWNKIQGYQHAFAK